MPARTPRNNTARGARRPDPVSRVVPLRPEPVPGGTSRRELNKLRRRRQILHGARECLRQSDIDDVSMDEIAGRSHVARGTLFNYFPSKGDIVKALVDETVDGFCRTIEEMNSRHTTVGGRMEAIFVEAASRILANSQLSRRILRPSHWQWGSALDDPESASRVIGALARTIATAADFHRNHRDVAPRDLAEIAIGVFSGIVGLWRLDPAYPLRRKMRQASRLVTEMIRGPEAS